MAVNDTKTRLAFLISTLAVGGYEIKLDMLAHYLDRERFEITVIWIYPDYKTATRHRETAVKLKALFQWDGVETVALPMKNRFDLHLVDTIARILKQREIDTLMFMALGPGTFLGPLAGKRAKVKKIIRASDTVLTDMYPRILKWFDRWLLQRTSRIVVPSVFLRDLMSRELSIGKDRFSVIPNGIDLSRFENLPSKIQSRSNLGFEPDSILIGMVANLNPVKRHSLLIEAAPQILHTFPKAQFVFIGDGVCREALETLAAQLKIRDHFHFLGHRSDVHALLPALDMGILCSSVETHGISLIEMMAAGIPVIANAVGGIPEIIDHKKTGYLMRSGDVNELAEAVVFMLKNPGIVQDITKRARLKAVQQFSQDHMVKSIEKESIIAE